MVLFFFFFSFSGTALCRIFLSLVESAGLTDMLRQDGDFTLFAPSDKAFRGVSQSDLAILTGMFQLFEIAVAVVSFDDVFEIQWGQASFYP